MNTLFKISRDDGQKLGPYDIYYVVALLSGDEAIGRLVDWYQAFMDIGGGWACELIGRTDHDPGVVVGVLK